MASSHSVNINIRVRPREAKKWRAAARRADETLSEWMRTRLNLLATEPPKSIPPVVTGDQIELPLEEEVLLDRAPLGKRSVR